MYFAPHALDVDPPGDALEWHERLALAVLHRAVLDAAHDRKRRRRNWLTSSRPLMYWCHVANLPWKTFCEHYDRLRNHHRPQSNHKNLKSNSTSPPSASTASTSKNARRISAVPARLEQR